VNPAKRKKTWDDARLHPRFHGLQEIAVNYEGHREEVAMRPPDISARGMFINTGRRFPEGAVLNLRFRLGISGAEIETRGEVRYCLPGVGVGVEFIGMSRGAVLAIEKEIKLNSRPRPRSKAK
jgi:PilZ domain-containing protein